MELNKKEADTQAQFMRDKARDLVEKSVEASPPELADINRDLNAIKSYFTEKLLNIVVFKNNKMEELRLELGKANAAKIKWASLDEGRNEVILRGIIGIIKDTISTNKDKLRIYKDDQFGNW